ncbi:plasmid pRiA4b ORF-3 family protein [bacterium]|nr:plasmid pRiA4b ORF-3 family protein [bacterium]MBU1651633.1 plasmid pRiA4b ORF-3 family protein [bacterium]
MIWMIKVKLCYCEPEISRTIEIDSDAALTTLHRAIQNAVDFDNDHLYEYFLGRSPTSRVRKIGKNNRLSAVFPLPEKGLKLYYLFDFGDEWTFQISKSTQKEQPPVSGVKYPRVVSSKGENPEQYPDYEE